MASRKLGFEVPESVLVAEKSDEAAFANELRLLAAIKLYELGRLSSGRAAGLAGMARVEFLLQLGRHRVFPFEAELRDLAAARKAPRPCCGRAAGEGKPAGAKSSAWYPGGTGEIRDSAS